MRYATGGNAAFRGFEQVTPEVLRAVFGLPDFATLTIPDDPEWLANLLPTHRYCDTAHRGHQSCVDEAARLLAAMRGAA